jgi:hypothetical protein
MAVETSVALHAYHPGPVSRRRVACGDRDFQVPAIDMDLGSWLQEVAPFLATQIGLPLRAQRAGPAAARVLCAQARYRGFKCQRVCCLSVSIKGVLVRARSL